MWNPLNHADRWLQNSAEDLISKNKGKHQNWLSALTTVDAATPSLSKVGEGYLSEDGDIRVFLFLMLDEKSKDVLCSIVTPGSTQDPSDPSDPSQEFQVRLQVSGDTARDLAASFMCDFPNALFSVDAGLPLVMFFENKEKRFVTLHNVIEAMENKQSKLVIAIPKVSK